MSTLKNIEEVLDKGIISPGQIDKMVFDHFQNQINQLKDFVEGYKKAVDRCDIEAVSSRAYFISSKTQELKSGAKFLTRPQSEEIDKLDLEYVTNFQRLKNECQCKKIK